MIDAERDRAEDLSFPAQHARTQRFTLGRPRSFQIAPDGSRVLFLRSPNWDDPATALWSLDLADGSERLVATTADLATVTEPGTDDLGAGGFTPEERAIRERVREMAGGITAVTTDRAVATAVVTVAGRTFRIDVESGATAPVATAGPAFAARPSPDGRRITYTTGGALRLIDTDGTDRVLAAEDGVTWGLAEFVAAEEMDRIRGYWWSPDSTRVVAARVDESDVAVWHISDPAYPDREPVAQRYPAAGTANADVQLAILDVNGGGDRVAVEWDRAAFPYLASVSWDEGAPLTLLVQSRDQRRWRILTVDPETGATTQVREDTDEAWLDLVPGTPTWSRDGLVVVVPTAAGVGGTNALLVGDEVVTPAGLQVRSVVHADLETGVVLFTASSDDPTQQHVWRFDPGGGVTCLTGRTAGVYGAVAAGGTQVLVGATLTSDVVATAVTADGVRHAIASHTAVPVVEPQPRLLELGERRLRGALLLPRDDPGGPLPVLLDVYGGPHHQEVLAARHVFLTSQWVADQGFAVLVVDGRGTPGRGPEFEREVDRDLATPVLEDQVDGLHAAAALEPRLDLDRVAIRGWSFGGYLSALAVLRRPDVFVAAVAGAPVTDWSLYDTHYTERYLGTPSSDPDAYAVSSLVDEEGRLLGAVPWAQPRHLLLLHGLADDNVVAAHTLRLSAALVADRRPHRMVLQSGATHMVPDEVAAETLMWLQVEFLREALGAVQPG